MHTHHKPSDPVATIGLDIGKNMFHLVGLDKRGAIAMRVKVSRSQLVRRLVNLPTCPANAPAIINQIRGFLIERGITVRQGPRPLRKVLPDVLSSPPEALSPRLLRLIADRRCLDERLEALSAEIASLTEDD